MSVYDHRETPAYVFRGNPEYLKNKYIWEWWTDKQDNQLKKQLELSWNWQWHITDRIVEITPNEVLEKWKKKDPLCNRYSWYNILMYFAISRAESLNLSNTHEYKWKVCPLCKNKFIENSLPSPLIERLGVNNIDFCAPCLRDHLFFPGINNLPKSKILDYIRDLTNIIQRIPPQNYGEGMYDIYDMSTEQRLAVLKILKRKPTLRRVKVLFKSWFNALIEAGVLEDDAQRLSRGTRCLANDGHVCLSLGEKSIDDLLYSMGIEHEKEPKYPEGNYRADFKVNNVLIEYFGLKGQPEYDKKIIIKKQICKKHGIKLLSLYPKNIINPKTLENKILRII